MQSLTEVRYLIAAVTLAEELNFTRAAARLKLSQSGLSRQISELERRHHIKLFNRDHATVSLTEAGRVFVEEARLSLLHDERAVLAARAAGDGVEAQLTIGRSPYADPILTSTLLSIRLPLYPRLRVNLHSDFVPDLVHGVQAGRLDAALIENPGENRKLTTAKVSESPFYIALQEGHPLSEQESLTLQDIREEGWILFDRKVHPLLHDQIQHRAHEEEIVVKRTQHVFSAEEAAQLVTENLGVAFLSKTGAQRVRGQGILVRPLIDKSLRLEVNLASRADNGSKLVSEFARAFMRRISLVLHPPQMTLPIG